MKTITVGEFKGNSSKVVERVKKVDSYTVSYGKAKEMIAVVVLYSQYSKKDKKLGLLSESKAGFEPDFKITDDELLTS